MIEALLPGLVVLVTIGVVGLVALLRQGDLDDVLHRHRCSQYCRPGQHIKHQKEE